MEFRDRIETLEQFREVMRPPSRLVTDKEFDTFDDECREFIARSPFVLVSSTDGYGKIDISPKGDAPGFVRVLDERTLVIPDRFGNHRTDTFLNVLEHPYVGLIFLVPGHKNTLRVRGQAEIVRDLDVRERLSANGSVPELVLAVHLTTGYFHCGKCIIRSELWEREREHRSADDRLLARAMVRHGHLDLSVDAMQEIIVDDERTRLY
ncbi:MAG: pyridoxamine 5'-phosphate oxidase family protein [Ilumatobacter sp.]|nr:pyridoxamine 5'-phosphate oxidase family protein [Ilumatobacter sp.]